MRDRLFFPLSAVLAGAFIMMALDPFASRVPSGPVSGGGRNAEDVKVEGAELHRFQPGNYESIAIIPASGDQPVLLRITRPVEQDYQDPRSGAHVILAEDIEYALEKRRIQIDIEARSVGEFPASKFEANYFSKADFETGWKAFDLTPEFQTYTLDFKTPTRGDTEGYDYIGIRPVTPDKYRVMEIRSVRVHALSGKE